MRETADEIVNDEVNAHRDDCNSLNDHIHITPLGQRGPGGAFQRYEIAPMRSVPVSAEKAAEGITASREPVNAVVLEFQQGDPRKEVNGLSNESLLAVVLHRLEGFQSGPFSNDDNNEAANHTLKALMALKRRSQSRASRGVEGQQKP